MKRILNAAFVVLALSLLCGTPAFAQPSGAVQSIAPLTRDLGALSTFTAHATGTVNTSDQNGYNVSRIVCVYSQTTSVAVPATTFSIQNKDAASGAYYTLVTSPSLGAAAVTVPIAAGAGIVSGANVSASFPIAKTWRVQTVIAGNTTATVTGTVGCSVQ